MADKINSHDQDLEDRLVAQIGVSLAQRLASQEPSLPKAQSIDALIVEAMREAATAAKMPLRNNPYTHVDILENPWNTNVTTTALLWCTSIANLTRQGQASLSIIPFALFWIVLLFLALAINIHSIYDAAPLMQSSLSDWFARTIEGALYL